MWIVAGLGNPGQEYQGTRHNVGFEVVSCLADRHGFPASKSFKKAEIARGRLGGHDLLLACPMTYMNLSGDAVGAIMRYYKCEAGDVIVVHDELDFAPGIVRFKHGGGHGGHNGLKSVSAHIGTSYARVRVGVGKPRGRGTDHVLSHFGGAERKVMDDAVLTAADAVEAIVCDGMPQAMNRFNQKQGSTDEAAAQNRGE